MRAKLRLIFSKSARLKLVIGLIGSVIVALAETGSVLLVGPLLAILAGSPTDEGMLGTVAGFLGTSDPEALIGILLAGVVVGFVLKDMFSIAFRWWILGFINREQARTATRILNYYLHAPYSLHLGRGTADLLRTMGTSVGQLYSLGVIAALNAITDSITIVALLVSMLIVMPLPTLMAFVYFGLAMFIFAKVIRPRAEAAGRTKMEAATHGYRAALHALGGVKEIKIRSAQPHFVNVYETVELKHAQALRMVGFLAEVPKYLLEALFILGLGGLIMFLLNTGGGIAAVTSIGLVGAAGFRLLPSLSRLMASISNLRVGAPALDEVCSELEQAERYESAETIAAAHDGTLDFTTHLEAKGLGFRYEDASTDVLNDINLRIPAGSTLALVGSSGAGKSTLVDIILGLHRPTAGTLTIDGRDLEDDLVKAWQHHVAMVPQEVFLLDTSLRENIAFDAASSDIDEDLLAEVIERAQLQDLVNSLDGGLDSSVGDRGSRLSGGQRQRVGIARALYRRPSLLVLDEATSALDNETEHKIIETINGLKGEVTVVIVAHRLSTVREADALAYMKNGRIAGYGTFEQVRASNADFARQVELGLLKVSDTDPVTS